MRSQWVDLLGVSSNHKCHFCSSFVRGRKDIDPREYYLVNYLDGK